jgi:hypothetical protein
MAQNDTRVIEDDDEFRPHRHAILKRPKLMSAVAKRESKPVVRGGALRQRLVHPLLGFANAWFLGISPSPLPRVEGEMQVPGGVELVRRSLLTLSQRHVKSPDVVDRAACCLCFSAHSSASSRLPNGPTCGDSSPCGSRDRTPFFGPPCVRVGCVVGPHRSGTGGRFGCA